EEDGSRDVVRHVADQDVRTSGKIAERDVEDVGLGDQHVASARVALAQQGGERAVVLDRNQAAGALGEDVGEPSPARPDLQDGLASLKLERVGDPAQDAPVVEKMLTEAFPRRWERLTAAPWRAPLAL